MTGEKGVLAGSPADLFENFSAHEAELVADAAPFRQRAMPIGGSRRGVPNKRTVAMRELYLKSGFPHPLLWMGSMLRLGIDGLAEALVVDKSEAAEILRKIAADALPYIEGKQPTTIVAKGDRLPVLVLGEMVGALGDLARAREEGALAIDDDVEPAVLAFEQNQALKAASGEASQDRASHATPSSLKDR